MNLGYIGLGALGGALARRLLASRPLSVWDQNPVAVERLAGAGATPAASAADLARRCDVVLLCLPRSADVRQVIFGPGGLAEGLSDGKLIIDQTSGIPGETREIAERLAMQGVAMMDTSVSASPQLVPQGAAVLMAGGPQAVFDSALPVLTGITETIYHCGPRVGDGQAMKTVNNAINGGCRLGTLEIVAIGRKLGLPLQAITEHFNSGDSANQTTLRMLPAIAEGKASTDFALALMLKDVNQAALLGAQLGVPMPIISVTRDLLQIGVNTLGPDARLEQVIGLTETLAAMRFTGPTATRDAAEQARLIAVLGEALAALCTLLTYEGVAAGLKYGLSIDAMATVLQRTSGWSGALRRILPALAAGTQGSNRPLRAMAEAATEAGGLAMEAGAPTLMLGAVRGILDAATNRLGRDTDRDALAGLYEEAAGIRFGSVP